MSERAAQGVWLNRRHLVELELDFQHEITRANGGTWSVVLLEAGALRARDHNGHVRAIDLAVGDSIVATSDDIYVGLTDRRTPRRVKPKARATAAAAEDPTPRARQRRSGRGAGAGAGAGR